MSANVFVDTNILIYAYDIDSPSKGAIAQKILLNLWLEHSGVLSMQVLQEFYVTSTRKLPSPLSKEKARTLIDHFSKWCIDTTPEEIQRAFQIEDEAQISFWDALIVSAAIKADAERILSEDLNPGQRIAGVLIENPFAS